MGQENQYLSIKWSGELKKWMLTGVYSGEVLQHTSFVFKIVSHMTWEMEFAGKKVLCYKCGKYFIDCETFHEERFHIVYKNTFQCDVTEPVKMIFRKAIRQIHGTVLVIWDSQKADDEIKRLKTESTAIELKGRQLCEEYIESVTSIDGALCIDSDGLCYGIGVILDSSIKLQGSAERGSRYNSTKKYVKQCLDKGIACVAVVVSEDQTIDFFWKETFDEEGVTYEQ